MNPTTHSFEPTYIYAFPVMGKTTLCSQFDYTDLDIHHPQLDPITHPIVLTNDPTLPCVGYFLPKDFEKAFATLPPFKQKYFKELGTYLEDQYKMVSQKEPLFKQPYITNDDVLQLIQ